VAGIPGADCARSVPAKLRSAKKDGQLCKEEIRQYAVSISFHYPPQDQVPTPGALVVRVTGTPVRMALGGSNN
jgi:hypothetical protein